MLNLGFTVGITGMEKASTAIVSSFEIQQWGPSDGHNQKAQSKKGSASEQHQEKAVAASFDHV
ncbi:MAG: hypothetical protein WBV28_18285 [Terracidiphilus sp.]